MKYDIISAPTYSLVEMTLNPGESVVVEPGSMTWMDTSIIPKTGGKKEWYNQVGVNNPELETETWEMGEKEFEKTISEARDFIREKRELVEEAEQQITGVK